MRSLSPFAAGALACLLLGPPAEAIDRERLTLARARIAKGEAQLKKKQYARAEKHFRAAIEQQPEMPTGHLGLGAALVGQQRFQEALVVLEEAERRFVDWEQKIHEADLLKRQVADRQLQAVRDLQGALASSRPNPSPGGPSAQQLAVTQLRIQTEQFLMRERWSLEGFDAIPPQVFYLEGIAYLRTGRPLLGIEALEICLLLDGGHGLAHYNLAVALFGRGEHQRAKEHLDRALEAGVEPHPQFAADLERALG